MSIKNLFRKDPTRQLEEVQKVTAHERLETDVEEFEETESAREVLTELGEVVETHPNNEPRFLYVEATFGSGKTHLLKLTGLVVDTESELADLGEKLATKWTGFDNLRRSVEASAVDCLKPVFLNLLDRDASKEPPLPFLIFEGIGRELDYPTDPNWLLEWVWRLDMEYDGVWDDLQEARHDGRTFEGVLEEKAYLRNWLYEALPAMAATNGTDLDTAAGVKESIEAAEADVDPESFDADELVERVETVTEALNETGGRTELMLGLDEVALFVGDSKERYREFETTMEALQYGPNPVVVTTGQYSLPDTRESLIGAPPEDHWTHRQVPLEGADTEIIVRRRWLSKNDDGGSERVAELLDSMPDVSLEADGDIGSAKPNAVESYPFREYDLALLRTVMQELITQGRETDRDYIQGRALLVLVRSLFTTFGWATAEDGSLVPWDVLFDLLAEETPYIPLWVQELLNNTLIPTFDGDEDAREVRVAKALYLLNQTPQVPATAENLARLRVDSVTDSVETVVEETTEALDKLVDKRLALTETTESGDAVYTLVSEEQESILRRAQEAAEQVSPHQLSAWVETRLTENERFFRSDGRRHEVDIGSERLVPLRYNYSVLDTVSRAPTPVYDALSVRVLADDPGKVAEQVETWQRVNDGRDGGEHVLVRVDIPEPMLQRIRDAIGMQHVLDEETGSHEELEREQRANKRQLESAVADVLDEAEIYTVHDHEGARSAVLERVIEEQVQTEFGTTRRTLSRPLTAVDDAKAMATFFRGGGDWPLSEADAAMLGVDTDTAEIGEAGWAQEFIENYESKKAVNAETILQQTRTANGAYRGTPQESIAALLITLATSNEKIALKQDTEYVTDPGAIGTQVRTKGGLTSLQIRFGVDIIDQTKVRTLVETVLGADPSGGGPDDWLGELGAWVSTNSVRVKRTLKGLDREFGVELGVFEGIIQPALQGEALSTAALDGEGRLETAIAEAERFADAQELFVADTDGDPLWAQFSAALGTMESLHPDSELTSSMRATAQSTSVPTATTVRSRIADAAAYRADQLSVQYQRVTGQSAPDAGPEAVVRAFASWLRSNEAAVARVIENARSEFAAVDLEALETMVETVWERGGLQEADIVDASVRRQAETYETCRELFGGGTEPSPWSQLRAAHERLQRDHEASPTTDAVGFVLASASPPRVRRVRSLLQEAEEPLPPEPGEQDWAELKRRAEDLRQELPDAAITDAVDAAVSGGERPSKARTGELLDEADAMLDRLRTVQQRLDELEDGSVVLIDRSDTS